MDWMLPLIAAGIDVSPNGDGTIDVAVDGHRARYRLKHSSRSPRPSEVGPMDGHVLLQVPHVSETVRAKLAEANVSFATSDGTVRLTFPDRFSWTHPPATSGSKPPEPAPKTWSQGRSRVVHALLLWNDHQPVSQVHLAQTAGLTQARVSTIVRALQNDGFVTTTRGRPTIVDRAALLDAWLTARRFTPLTTYWSASGDLANAWEQVRKHLPGRLVVSGDVAADARAPHRRPRQLRVLTRAGSLTGSGLLAVTDEDDADVVVEVTDDPVVFTSSRPVVWRHLELDVADDVQILWDLLRSPGPDRDQAASVWRRRVVAPT